MKSVFDFGSAIGGALGMIGNIFGVTSANDQNKELVERQNQLNIEQWNRENAYNHPAAQMQRLKEAGLNPNLMYGNGAGSMLSAPSPEMQAAHVNPVQVDPLTMAQIANINADTEQKKAVTNQTTVNTDSVRIDNFFKSFQKDFIESNKEMIERFAHTQVQAGMASSVDEFYKSYYSAAILSSFFGLDDNEDGTFSTGTIHYSKEVRDKFYSLGLSEYEQTMLERGLYKTYVEAQKKVNKRSGEVADMETIIPEMVNGAPKWLKPILVILNSWFNGSKTPSFIYSPNKSVKNDYSDRSTSNAFKNLIRN